MKKNLFKNMSRMVMALAVVANDKKNRTTSNVDFWPRNVLMFLISCANIQKIV